MNGPRPLPPVVCVHLKAWIPEGLETARPLQLFAHDARGYSDIRGYTPANLDVKLKHAAKL
jgi:hypothetical protein